MLNVMEKIKARDDRRDFKLEMVAMFALVAISFFAVGFLYAKVPQAEVLFKLLALFGSINAVFIYYLCKKFNCLSNT